MGNLYLNGFAFIFRSASLWEAALALLPVRLSVILAVRVRDTWVGWLESIYRLVELGRVGLLDRTFALSLPVEHTRPQTTCLHPALSCADASIFLQLYLYPAGHISFSRSLFQVFLGRSLPLWPCCVHCSTCLVMLSSFILNVCPSQFHFFIRVWSSTGSWPVCFHIFLLEIMSGQCILRILYSW